MLQVDLSALVVFAIVWILVVVLTKVFFKPIQGIVRKREEGLREDREAGEKAQSEYEASLQKIEDDIKQARSSSYRIRDKFEKEALKEKERMLSEVSKECRSQVDEARKELTQQIDELKADLKDQSEQLAEKIEKRLLDK
jgi:F-type H+-transporting ATPase subunit b